MGKIWQAIKDWWEVAVAFGGAIYSAYDIASQLQAFDVFMPDMLFAVGLFLFLLFGSIAILKAVKKGREKKPSISDEQNIGVQSKNQHGGLTAHTIAIHAVLPQQDEPISKEVSLTIIPQEKDIDGNSYILKAGTNCGFKVWTKQTLVRLEA